MSVASTPRSRSREFAGRQDEGMSVDRELLIEIGCEELPAGWLPGLTTQLADVLSERLVTAGLHDGCAVEAFSTPRRLVARVAQILARQSDRDETVTGPPVSAAFTADGQPTKAGLGFARKQGVSAEALERIETDKGVYVACRRIVQGQIAEAVLPSVLGETLRRLSFPKKMHWDAALDDGRGDLLFGRPIRWLVFLFDGRIVPFVIGRTAGAASAHVRDVCAGSATYGHRFLAADGPIEISSYDDYRSRLASHFVVLDRQERQDRIAAQLETLAAAQGGRVWLQPGAQRSLLDEVPDLVEYPTVIAGAFGAKFLDLPDEVLATAMIHHQHYVPVADAAGRLTGGFLAVTNADGDPNGVIAGNAQRVLTARLRDAQFFWAADRAQRLDTRMDRLGTLAFHARLGSYRDKAARLQRLSAWVAREALARPDAATDAAEAGRLAKVDLTTEMVREFTELQGTMGGIYARLEGQPEAVWKAIYYQYLPVGVERDEPPLRTDLGASGASWAAVAIADRVDTLVGLHGAGERPSGTRDPFGMRRHAQGLMKILVDLPDLADTDAAPTLGALTREAASGFEGAPGSHPEGDAAMTPLLEFLVERLRHLCNVRGVAYDEVNAVLAPYQGRLGDVAPLDVWRRLSALRAARPSDDLDALAILFKRVKNITRDQRDGARDSSRGDGRDVGDVLSDPAERELLAALRAREPVIREAMGGGDYRRALTVAAELRPAVDRFFSDVFVMVEDERLRSARLRVLAELRDLILDLADISELVPSSETET